MATTKYYAACSEKLEEIDEEEQMMWQHQEEEEEEEIEEDDDELMIEDASSMSSSPSIPDENINFDLVYALHTFVATVEGQASVVKGDALILMEDTNIYWWLVEVLKTREVGYIPAENIETPYERLARLNKHRNVEITSPSIHDIAPLPISISHPLNPTRRVTIGDESLSKIFHYEVESDIDEEDEDGENAYEHASSEDDEEQVQQQLEQAEIYNTNNNNQFQEIKYDQEEPPVTVVETWQEKNWEETNLDLTLMEEEKMELRVFAGNIGQGPLFHTFPILISTPAEELLKISVNKFGMNLESSQDTTIEYYLAVQGMDGDEYILSPQDKPYSIFKTLTDSLTTPMPSLSHIRRISQQSISSSTSSRRPRSSSFSNYEQTSYDEDSVIRIYLHRRIKRAVEREGLMYIKVSLYPDRKKLKKKSEIDRIDKIIPVKKDYKIGIVINLALEKFHVPDAEADDYPTEGGGESSRQLGKYRMSLRSSNKETELNPNELMSNVLLEYSTTTTITSDLLFVLRKAGSVIKQSQKQRHSSKTSDKSSLPTQLSLTTDEKDMVSEDRRPSILDILMDTPKSIERRPSAISNLLQDPSSTLPPPRFAEEKGRTTSSTNNNYQDRKYSLNNTSDSFTSTSSSLSFPPPIIQSEDNINMDSNIIVEVTPTSSSSIMTRSTASEKKKESLKQQFKRFVGWGSSSSSTTSKKSLASPPPPLTTINTHYNNVLDSPSDLSFVSAPSTPLPPTPGTPRSLTSKSRQGSQQLHGESKLILEVNTPTSMSRRPSETTTLNDPSAASLAVASVVSATNNKRLSTVSSVSSSSSTSSTSSVTSEEVAVASKKATLEESDDSDNEIDRLKKNNAMETPIITTETEDIQTQYAMWMNSQPAVAAAPTNVVVIQPTPVKTVVAPVVVPAVAAVVTPPTTPAPVINSAIANKALPPVITNNNNNVPPPSAKSPLRNKSSSISNTTTTVASTPSPSLKEERSLHPMTNQGQDLDDLFLLVAHGVDFLTTKENTKWEEEGGYEFHPWNRPQSSFAVKQVQRTKKDMPPLPISTTSSTSLNNNNTSNNNSNNTAAAAATSAAAAAITSTNTTEDSNDESTSAALAMARSLLSTEETEETSKPISPPLTPSPQPAVVEEESPLSMAKRILGAKHEPVVAPVIPAPVQSQPQQSVDDEELQRIVACHIFF